MARFRHLLTPAGVTRIFFWIALLLTSHWQQRTVQDQREPKREFTSISKMDIDDLVRQIGANDASLTDVVLSGLCRNEEISMLAEALACNTHVRKLDLRYSNLGEGRLATLASALSTSCIYALVLCNCRIRNTEPLADALVTPSCVVSSLDLRHNEIGDGGVKCLSKSLAVTGFCLRSLALGSCCITDDGARYLASSLGKNGCLEELDLRENKISDVGATALARALILRPALMLLDLRENQIGERGAKALAAFLVNDKALKELNLSDNRIGNMGTKALAKSMMLNTTMKRLILSENLIEVEGAQAFLDAMEYNDSLIYLDLSRNAACKEIRQKIGKLLEASRTGSRSKKMRHSSSSQSTNDSKCGYTVGIVKGILTTLSENQMCAGSTTTHRYSSK